MKILLFGANGQVGWELARSLAPLGELEAVGRPEADFEDLDRLRETVRRAAASILVNAAAWTAVEEAEDEPARALRVNAEAVALLAEEAKASGALLVHYSTDYVFAGEKPVAYTEDDPTGPLNAYGRSKLAGEEAIRASGCRHLVFRTSWVYAARGKNFVRTILRLARERTSLEVVDDQVGAPTSAELVADATALCLHRLRCEPSLAQRGAGTYHLAAAGETSWCRFARFVLQEAACAGMRLALAPEAVCAVSSRDVPQRARRPQNSRLDTARLERTFGLRMPHWRWHAARTVRQIARQGEA